ncbi:MAG: trypsin-like serine protease [Bdellovibrionaceae bacterium]|nr:trypsin-like serine protease [Pseudobdellovibrionaceae bacterium]MBX3034731.1 trypsin-like serine protease [Pseudobdellovibrionaceae bacterium]
MRITPIASTLILLGTSLAQAALTADGCAPLSTIQNLARQATPIVEASLERTPSHTPDQKTAAIYGRDNRYVDENPEGPFRMLGKIKIGSGHCTAVMISACHALTAGHCTNLAKEQPEGDRTITYVSADGKHQSVATRAWGNGKITSVSNKDWGLIQLKEPIGQSTGWMSLVNTGGGATKTLLKSLCPTSRPPLILAGYSADIEEGHGLSVDDQVKLIHSDDDNILRFRANSFKGSSGAPLWRLNCNNQPEIIGVNIGAAVSVDPDGNQVTLRQNEDKILAAGLATRQFFKKVKQLMEKSPCPVN